MTKEREKHKDLWEKDKKLNRFLENFIFTSTHRKNIKGRKDKHSRLDLRQCSGESAVLESICVFSFLVSPFFQILSFFFF